MRTARVMPFALALAAILLPSVRARAQMPAPRGTVGLDRFVLTVRDACGLLPPELIAQPVVANVTPSPDGRYLLVERQTMRLTAEGLRAAVAGKQPPPGEVSLILWDSRTRSGREVWRAATPAARLTQVTWLNGVDIAFAQVDEILPPDPSRPDAKPEQRRGILRISPGVERAQVVGATDPGAPTYLSLFVSPARPEALVRSDVYREQTIPQPDGTTQRRMEAEQRLYTLSASGKLGPAIPLPPDVYPADVRWTQAGGIAVQIFQRVQSFGVGKPQPPTWYALDTRTGALKPMEKSPPEPTPVAPPTPKAVGDLRLTQTTLTAKEGETAQPLRLLWLESATKTEKPRALVSAESSGGWLTPAGDAVVYHAQGALYAAPLLRITRDEYAAMVRQAQIAAALQQGKQVGLGILMYAADYDETLPQGDLASAVGPYLKDTSLLAGFNYTLGGGRLADIAKPAETQLGSIAAGGGLVVVWADGHVTFKKDGGD